MTLELGPRLSHSVLPKELLLSFGQTELSKSGLIHALTPTLILTAFWICFNRHDQPDEWGAAEWKFFVEDALSHLREGGILHLELNANLARYQSLQWYDQETLQFFRSVGTVERNVVRVTKGKPQGWGTVPKPA